MKNLDEQIADIKGYSYQLWQYARGHSELTIRGMHDEKKGHNIHITFLNVQYFQFPLEWTGDLYPASDEELLNTLRQTRFGNVADKTSVEILKKMYSLYIADSSNGRIYVLGRLIKIEYDVEPFYD